MRPRLYIFAKAPAMGKAKTRLAADIGKVHAHRLYRAMLSKVIRQVQDPRWDTIVMATPKRAIGKVPEWDGVPQHPQASGSLSPRLLAAFNGRGPVVVIGTDCPQVMSSDIADGFDALKKHSAVFGPADDGGFWLMGMNGPVKPTIFDNVRWSHEDTLSDVEANIDGSVKHLRTLIDVDDLKALRALRSLSPRQL
ncbi:TIGR04282 family arsenosugar biosynthesis glycosyltransferase [Hellea balneolensis]|uniref:TIGR04282 family arsenosugar biosynthesis glycosyltransferase n=1 Tax=Hellea balneolensis TaxID=287478 RepID=UPI0004259C34|nr:TIGR04282 family arsenosugar biosynthesis glycosyltransferase [Hellea balneolensis]